MENVRIDTSQNVQLDVELAGIGDRLIALIVDYLIIGAYLITVGLLSAMIHDVSDGAGVFAFLLFLIPVPFYFLVCEILLDGQTPGKRYMDVQVRRLDGTAPSLGGYLLRWLLRPVDFTMTSGGGALLSALITGTGQRLGDLAAGTTVVRTRPSTSARDLSLADVDPDYTPQFSEVQRLSDEDIRLVKDAVAVMRHTPDSSKTEEMGSRIKKALERKMGTTSDLDPRAFLDTLVQDYAAYFG